jgi:hypothetical protein
VVAIQNTLRAVLHRFATPPPAADFRLNDIKGSDAQGRAIDARIKSCAAALLGLRDPKVFSKDPGGHVAQLGNGVSAEGAGDQILVIKGPGCPAGFLLASGQVVDPKTRGSAPAASMPLAQRAAIAKTLQFARETLYKSEGPPYGNHGRAAAPIGYPSVAIKSK